MFCVKKEVSMSFTSGSAKKEEDLRPETAGSSVKKTVD